MRMTIGSWKQRERHTYDAIAEKLNVSRMSVHKWANNGVMVDWNSKTKVLVVLGADRAEGVFDE